MAELKTRPNDASVAGFLATIDDPGRRADARKVAAMMRRATGKRAKMWGTSIVGYGSYHYKYASGREGDFILTGYSPRKTALTVYIMPGFSPFKSLMSKLGKYKTGKSCLYINKLGDVDMDVLEELLEKDWATMQRVYPPE